MVPTVDSEKSPLLGTQNTRPTTIEMTENSEAEDDGVLWRHRTRALPARRGLLFRHWQHPQCKAGPIDLPPGGTTPACVNPGCSVVGDGRLALAARVWYQVLTW